MKRKLSLALAILMLIAVFVACADDKTNTPSGGEIVGKEQIDYNDTIPDDYNLSGEKIGIFTGSTSGTAQDIFGDNEALDIVYTTIYERNLKVQARLNFELVPVIASISQWQDVTPIIRQYITIMDDSFDIVTTGNNSVIQMKIFNLFHNLNFSNYIDIGEEFWYEDAIMECSVDNYYYRFLYGDISINNLGVAGAIYYNKNLYSQYVDPGNPDGLYKYVIDGTWTLEQFDIEAKNCDIELGGENDIHGYSLFRGAEQTHYFAASCGIEYYQRNARGFPIVTIYNDKAADFIQKLYDLYYNNPGAWLFYPNQVGIEVEHSTDFPDRKVVFLLGSLNNMLDENMRGMEDEYGVLPYPKWDSSQEEYHNFIHNSSKLVGIGKNVTEDRANEEVSAVIEALCSESNRSVIPAFYEQALQKAYSRDDTTIQMIDIICGRDDEIDSTLKKNFLYEYSTSCASMGSIFSTILGKGAIGAPNFTSTYESMIGSAETQLSELFQDYLKDAQAD